jgi:hypothetical protein
MADVSRGQRNDVENTPAIPAVATVVSIEEAIQQAERIAEARKGGHFQAELRKSNSSVQEWILVPLPPDRFRVGQDGRPPLDTLDAY